MTTQKKAIKSKRIVRSDEYRKDAVKLSETVGVTEAAKQLGVHTTQIYTWRNKIRVKESRTDAEVRLTDENARLKRELAEKKQENEFQKRPARTLQNSRSEVRVHQIRAVCSTSNQAVRVV